MFMEGVIINYRGSHKTMKGNQVIVEVKGIEKREQAKELVGKRAVYVTESGKRLIGKITAPHGNKGRVRVRFEKGVPGQALGRKVVIE